MMNECKILWIPENEKVVGTIFIGYPEEGHEVPAKDEFLLKKKRLGCNKGERDWHDKVWY